MDSKKPKSATTCTTSDASNLASHTEYETQLLAILGRISDGIVALDRDWNYTYVNSAAAQMLQRDSPADLIGRHIWTEYPEGIGQPFHRAYEVALETQKLVVFEEYYEPWDKWFENRIYPSSDGLTIYFSETTTQVKAAIAARQAATVFSNTKDSVVISDINNKITNVNPAFLKTTGFAEVEIIGRNIAILFDDVTGNPSWVDVNTTNSWSGPLLGKRKAGNLFPQVGARETLFNPKGVKEGDILITSDLTELRQKEAAERQLAQAQKMEAIGELTGGMAHDFNNLLAVILGNLELFREEIKEPGAAPHHFDDLIEAAIDATMRGADLTRNMLSFARKAVLEPTVLDLNAVVSKARNWIGRTLRESISLETSLLAGLWVIEADESATQSALLNLMLNARDAMPDGGRMTIETSNVRIDEDYLQSRNESIPAGRYVMLAVSDTGTGISSEVIEHIFEPFFSTKGPGAGSGLGLPMVQGFIKQSGGAIQVYSELGVGTTIKLYFKVKTDPVHEHEDRDDLDAVTANSFNNGHILLVEDNAAVLAILTATLKKAGYQVSSVTSGDKAKTMYASNQSFDLVLTDIVMPGRLQGTTLAKELRAITPDLPIVFMSGYASEATVHGNGLRPEDIRLMKPVRQLDLIAAVERALAISKKKAV